MAITTCTTVRDFLAGRENVSQGSDAELNAKLAAVAARFGEGWLSSGSQSPLQRLWTRTDALATNELLNFGDALERLHAEDPAWLGQQVALIKTGDRGNAAGAIFEILALNLFSRDNCTVIPAPASMPGFDGTLALADGARVLVSVKNHGMSNYERDFHKAAAEFDAAFRKKLAQAGLRDVYLRVVMNRHPDRAAWNDLAADMERMLDQEGVDGTANGPWTIMVNPIGDSYGPLSATQWSSSCQILGPHHQNEQDKFVEDIRKGCANLARHTRNETSGEVCRMIVLRLSATASIEKCMEWANWYFQDDPDSPVGVILLYQTAVADTGPAQSGVTHFLIPILGPRFDAWRTLENGTKRSLPSLSVFVGQVVDKPVALALSDGGSSVDISSYYAYQRADIYKTHDPSLSSGMIEIGSPAAGVTLHLVLETPGYDPNVISKIHHTPRTLELLP